MSLLRCHFKDSDWTSFTGIFWIVQRGLDFLSEHRFHFEWRSEALRDCPPPKKVGNHWAHNSKESTEESDWAEIKARKSEAFVPCQQQAARFVLRLVCWQRKRHNQREKKETWRVWWWRRLWALVFVSVGLQRRWFVCFAWLALRWCERHRREKAFLLRLLCSRSLVVFLFSNSWCIGGARAQHSVCVRAECVMYPAVVCCWSTFFYSFPVARKSGRTKNFV